MTSTSTFVQAIHGIMFRVRVAAQALRTAQVAITPSLNTNSDRWVPHVLPFHHDTLPCALEVKIPHATMNAYLENCSVAIKGLAKFLLCTSILGSLGMNVTFLLLLTLRNRWTSLQVQQLPQQKLSPCKFAPLLRTLHLSSVSCLHLTARCCSAHPHPFTTGCMPMALTIDLSTRARRHIFMLTLPLHLMLPC